MTYADSAYLETGSTQTRASLTDSEMFKTSGENESLFSHSALDTPVKTIQTGCEGTFDRIQLMRLSDTCSYSLYDFLQAY